MMELSSIFGPHEHLDDSTMVSESESAAHCHVEDQNDKLAEK